MEFNITMFSKHYQVIKQQDVLEFLVHFVIPYMKETYGEAHGCEAIADRGVISFKFRNDTLPFAMVEDK